MRGSQVYAVLVATLALACGAPAVVAQSLPGEHLVDGLVLASSGMSLDQAVAMAERRYKARVVRADARKEEGRTIYVLRLLNDSGRVWTVRIDADTGAVL
jgi:uncharacterized membrane protein YkoI